MPPIAPTPMSGLGTPPSTTDSANFDTRADDLLGTELPQFVTEANALSTNVFNNATSAYNSAAAAAASEGNANTKAVQAAASAAAAAASAGAAMWVSGATYSVGNAVMSSMDLSIYRRKTNGAGTTDPRLDATNWAPGVPVNVSSLLVLNQLFGVL